MNQCFRLVWNELTATWVAVAETTKSSGKRRAGAVLLAAAGLVAALPVQTLAQTAPAPNTLPIGGQLVGGQATIGQSAANMTITQASQRAAIDWQTFNIGSAAQVNFVQPSSSAAILNRVLDANPSQIFGRLNSNGHVFITNPSGIYFGPSASANVGALTATTHSISNADFMAGKLLFSRNGSTAAVINEGSLTADLNGYVALLAPEVRNRGVVVARMGTVALAAGETFELQLDGNNTLAQLRVSPATIQTLVENGNAVRAPGGLIILSAQAADHLQGGIVKNSGVLEANGLVNKGGRILLSGKQIALTNTSKIEATGVAGGGEVYVGGGWQGTIAGDAPNAQTVVMADTATVDVSATNKGAGGTAVLWSEGYTGFYGSISARGGAHGGNGGQVETSSRDNLQVFGRVDAAAPLGKAGSWLLDPRNLTITNTSAGGSFNSADPNVFTPTADNSSVLNTTIEDSLNAGTSVTLTTGATGSQAGNITLASNIVKSIGSAATLTLNAHGNIVVNAGATISDTGAPGGLSVGFYSKGAIYFTGNAAATNVIDIQGALHLGGFGQTYATGNSTYANGIFVGANNILKSDYLRAFGAGTAGADGAAGTAGANGRAGSNTVVTSPNGARGTNGAKGTAVTLYGEHGGPGGAGIDGRKGESGAPGSDGNNGLLGAQGGSGIAFSALSGIETKNGQTFDGQGGSGGKGGSGGRGGDGGKGGAGGNGGAGGAGGNGGASFISGSGQSGAANGGNGGRGGDAGEGGTGGKAGNGGDGGAGGVGGAGLDLQGATLHDFAGSVTVTGRAGQAGSAGNPGTPGQVGVGGARGGRGLGGAGGTGGSVSSFPGINGSPGNTWGRDGISGDVGTAGQSATQVNSGIGFITSGVSFLRGSASPNTSIISITSDRILLSATTSINSNGLLHIQPLTTGTTLGIGSASANGTLQLPQSYFWNGTAGVIKDGFAGITLGNASAGAVTLGALTYADALTVQSAGAITLNGTVQDAGSGALSGALYLLAGSTISGSGGITTHGQNLLLRTASGTGTLSGIIALGSGKVTKTGAGTSVFSGANTYLGSTEVDEGTLAVANAAGLGGTEGETKVAAGATLDIRNVAVGAESVFLNGGTLQSTGTASLAGAVALAADTTIQVGGIQLSLSGAISDGASAYGINKTGTGTLLLSGANTYDGVTAVTAGTLAASHATALGSTLGGTTLASGTTLDLQNALVGEENVTSAGATIKASTGTSSLGGGINLTANTTLDAGTGAQLTLAGAIDGAFGLTKTTGAGSVVLAGNNSYTGVTAVNGGALAAASELALGTTAAGTTVASGARLDIRNAAVGNEAVSLAGGTLTASVGTSSLVGNVTMTASSTVDASSGAALDVRGIVSGAHNLSKGAGAGTVTLSATNTYTGTTTVSAGTLKLGMATALGSGAVTVGSSAISTASLDLNGFAINRALTLNGHGAAGPGGTVGTLTNSSATAASNSGTVALNSGSTVGGSAGDIALTGVISGSSGLTKVGSSLVKLSSSSNSYTGATAVSGGILQVDGAGGLGSGSYAGAISLASGATLQYSSSAAQTFSGAMSGEGALLKDTGSANTLSLTGGSSFTGPITVNAGTLQIGSAGSLGSGTYTGDVAIGSGATFTYASSAAQTLSGMVSGAGALTKTTGTNTLTLSGTNTYSGNTSVSAGTLKLGNAAALGTSAVAVTTGGALDLNGQSISNNATLNGTGVSSTGALTNSSAAVGASSGSVALAAAASVGGAGNINLTGSVSGGFQLTKVSANTLALFGTNSYSGGTVVSAGTLKAGSGAALGSGAANVTSGAALDLNGQTLSNNLTLNGSGISGTGALTNSSAAAASHSGTVALASASTVGGSGDIGLDGVVSGTGLLTKASANTLTLSNANTYTGGTAVNAGTLIVTSGGTLGATSAALSINNATLDLHGKALSVGSLVMSGAAPSIINSTGTGSLSVTGTSTLKNSVTTAGTQTYTGAVTLGASTALSTTHTDISLGATVNGNFGLTLNQGSGNANFNGIVGGTTSLASLNVAGTGNTVLGANATGVSTSGAQSYAGGMKLTATNTTLSSSAGNGAVAIAGAVDSNLLAFVNQAYTTPGNFTFTAPNSNNLGPATLLVVGGGGAGMSDTAGGTGNLAGAGGGAGGVYYNTNIFLTPGNSYSVVVGRGGNGQISRDPGSYSKFDTYSAGGGNFNADSNSNCGGVSCSSVGYGKGGYTINRLRAGTTGQYDFFYFAADSARSPQFGGTNHVGGSPVSSTRGGGGAGAGGSGSSTSEGGDGLRFNIGVTTYLVSAGGAGAYSVGRTGGGLVNGVEVGGFGGSAGSVNGGNAIVSGFGSGGGGAYSSNNNNVVAGSGSGGVVVVSYSYNGAPGANLTVNAGSGQVRLGSAANLGTLTVNSSNTASQVSGAISGTGSKLRYDGTAAGVLSLQAASTYTGGSLVSGGTLKLGNATALGTGAAFAGSVATSTASLDLNGQTIANNLALAGYGAGGLNGTVAALTNSNATSAASSGAVALNEAATVGGSVGNIGLTGVVSGRAALSKVGSKTLSLSGNNNFTGATNVNAGTLTVASNTGLGSTGSGTTVSSGATLDLSGVTVGAEAVTLSGGTLKGSVGAANASASSLSGTVSMTAASTVDADNGAQLTLSGVVSGNFGLSKSTSTGTVVLAAANSYTGATTVNGGTLGVTANNALSLTGTTVNSGATLDFRGVGYTTTADGVTLNGGTLAASTGTSSFAGAVVLGADSPVNVGGTQLTLSGVVSGAGKGLTKTGSGKLILSGPETYTGMTHIHAGTLELGAANRLPDANAVTVASGATFALNNFAETIGSISGAGSISLGSATLTTGNASSATFSGAISGTGGLSKTGSGTFTLSGNSTFSGLTTVSAGTLAVTSSTALGNSGSSAAGTSVAAGAVLDLQNVLNVAEPITLSAGGAGGSILRSSSGTSSASGLITLGATSRIDVTGNGLTLSGVITDGASSFGMDKTGSGTLALTGSNTYDGTTTATAGTLSIAANSALGTGGLTLGGAVLEVTDNVDLGSRAVTVNTNSTLRAAAEKTLSGGVFAAANRTIDLAGGSFTLNHASNDFGTVTATSAVDVSIVDTNDLALGNMTLRSLVAQAGAQGGTPGAGNLTLNGAINASMVGSGTGPGTGTANAVVLATGAGTSAFVNNFGTNAITLSGAGDPRWLIYLNDPYTAVNGDVLGNLQSSNDGIFGKVYTGYAGTVYAPATVTETGNRYLLRMPSQAATANEVSVTTIDRIKTYGDALVLNNSGYRLSYAAGSTARTEFSDAKPIWVNDSAAALSSDGAAAGATVNGGTVGSNRYQINISGLTSSDATKNLIIYNLGHVKVTPRGLSLTTTAGTGTVSPREYDGTTLASFAVAPVLTLGNVVNNDSVSLTGTAVGQFADKHVGNGKTVSLGGVSLDNVNYSLPSVLPSFTGDITPRSITLSAAAADKTYDRTTNATVTALTADRRIAGDDLAFASTGAAFASANVARSGHAVTGPVVAQSVTVSGLSLSGAAVADYALTSTSTTALAKINPIALSLTGLTGSKVYDGSEVLTTPTVSVDVTAVLSGDTVGVTASSANFDDHHVAGGKALHVDLATLLLDNGNYSMGTGTYTGTGDVSAKPVTLNLPAVERAYDGTLSYNASAAVLAFLTTQLGVTRDAVTQAAGIYNSANAGTGRSVTLSSATVSDGNSGKNYDVTLAGGTGSSISKANLSVRSSNVSKTYDGNTTINGNLVVTGTIYTNASNGDVLDTLSGGTFAFADKNAGTNKTVMLSDVAVDDGNAGSNYNLIYATNTTSTITPFVINLSGTRVYDRTMDVNASALSFSAAVGSETLNLSGLGLVADKNVGVNKPLSLNSLVLADGTQGGVASNYTLAGGAHTFNITAKNITASYTGIQKEYDRITAAQVTGSMNGAIADDVLNLVQSAAYTSSAAGSNRTINVTSIALTGADAGNYALLNTTASTAAGITAKTVTASYVAEHKTYDRTTTASVTGSSAGIMADDTVSFTQSAVFENRNAGTGKTVLVSDIALDGADAVNYRLSSTTASTTANIAAKALTASYTADNKVYDSTSNASVEGTVAGVISGDVVDTTQAAAFLDKNAGTAKAVHVSAIALSGTHASNYVLTSTTASATANIDARPLTASYVAANKTYDANTTASVTGSSEDIFTGDVIRFTQTANFVDKNVGNEKPVDVAGIVLGGADAGNYALANSTANATADITPKMLGLNLQGQGSKIYDGTASISLVGVTPSLSGVLGTDAVSVAAGAVTGFVDKNAGSSKAVTFTGFGISGADADNYQLVSGSAPSSADITPKLIILSGTLGANKVYDGTNTAYLQSVGILDGLIENDAVNVSYLGASFDSKNVGNGKTITVAGVSLNGADSVNYSVAATATTQADTIAKLLALDLQGEGGKVYDGTASISLNGITPTLLGVVGMDNVTLNSGTVTGFASKNSGMNKAVVFTGFNLSGSDSTNYKLASGSTISTAFISAQPLSVNFTAMDKVYDGTTNASIASSSSDVIDGDEIHFTYTASFRNKNAETGKAVNINAIALSGTDADNYSLQSTIATATADINKAFLVVTGNDARKTVDGLTYVGGNGVTYSGFVHEDNSNELYGALSYSGNSQGATAPGRYSIVPLGLSSQNYAINFAGGTLNILPNNVPIPIPVVPPLTNPGTFTVGGKNNSTGRISTEENLFQPPSEGAEIQFFTSKNVISEVAQIENLTSANVGVSVLRTPSSQEVGIVAVLVPKEMINGGTGFSFPLPTTLLDASGLNGSTIQVTTITGNSLPTWLKFDPVSNMFTASAVSDGALPMQVIVVIGKNSWTIVISEKQI